MPSIASLAQIASIVSAMPPATDAAGRTGGYVTLKNAHGAYFVWNITQGNAATIALSVSQAKAVAGTTAKALSSGIRWWAALDIATTDVLVRQTDGASFTTDAGVKNKIVVAQIDVADLDLANAYTSVAPVTGASNAANITSCLAVLTPLRFAGDAPPTAIVD